MKDRSLLYLAQKISAHLKRIEADETLNPDIELKGTIHRHFYWSGASVAGSRVSITYVTYQGSHTLTKAQAGVYLDWLDNGNVGTWHQCSNRLELK